MVEGGDRRRVRSWQVLACQQCARRFSRTPSPRKLATRIALSRGVSPRLIKIHLFVIFYVQVPSFLDSQTGRVDRHPLESPGVHGLAVANRPPSLGLVLLPHPGTNSSTAPGPSSYYHRSPLHPGAKVTPFISPSRQGCGKRRLRTKWRG